jgi:hypothetical protein
MVYHDEDCEIFINGVLAASARGKSPGYGILSMNENGKKALVSDGNNVIAVHCRQTVKDQYIDAGIVKVEILP